MKIDLWTVLLGCNLGVLYWIIDLLIKRPTKKVYVSKMDGWENVETFPHSREPGSRDILITDGESVDSMISPTYNKDGKLVLSIYREKSIVTHWMYFPKPPIGDEK